MSTPTALVTGGSRGLGLAFAQELANRGYRVIVTSRDPDSMQSRNALQSLLPHAAGHSAMRWEIGEAGASRSLLREIRSQCISLSAAVHCAYAFMPYAPILTTPPETFMAGVHDNLAASYALCQALCWHMQKNQGGRVLLVGSWAAALGLPGQVAYCAEKSALEGMMRVFAREFAAANVLLNMVHPGIIGTENVLAKLDAAVLENYRRHDPAGSLLTPRDIVLASMSLLDPGQRAVTGKSLILDGGFRLP
jgi:NAD(P)-dependent dehydrogenase (short-subunit alcohol dehydrogenase family)